MSSTLFQNVAKHPLIRINPSKVQQIWEATASFMLSKIQSQRGIKLHNFGQFNFVKHQKHVGLVTKDSFTPFFWLSRTFQSQNQITQPFCPHIANLATVSLNYTTIAARSQADKQLVQDVISTTIITLGSMVKRGITTQLILPGIGKLDFQCGGFKKFKFITAKSLQLFFEKGEYLPPRRTIQAYPASKLPSSCPSSRSSTRVTFVESEVEEKPKVIESSSKAKKFEPMSFSTKKTNDRLNANNFLEPLDKSNFKALKTEYKGMEDIDSNMASDYVMFKKEDNDKTMIVGQDNENEFLRNEAEEEEDMPTIVSSYDALPTLEDDEDLLESSRKIAKEIAKENEMRAESRKSQRQYDSNDAGSSYVFSNRPPTPRKSPIDRQQLLEKQLEITKEKHRIELENIDKERAEMEANHERFLQEEEFERLQRLESQRKQRLALDEQLHETTSTVTEGFLIDPDNFSPIAFDGSVEDMRHRREEATRLAKEAKQQVRTAQLKRKQYVQEQMEQAQKDLEMSRTEYIEMKKIEFERKLRQRKEINDALAKQLAEKHLRVRINDVEEVPFPLSSSY
eukprot:TRINITY_DN1248_c0_g1_i1.p1 TRINITY_DN1248_c0_g1~~TRINITY_DN1248_c0_g1_i1.p1  ORF type:complete len:568 (-),score=162.72 TRINITY_DN1248_c0_g1_i1:29-1732(-)